MDENKTGTITISTEEYKILMKDSLTLQIIERYVKEERYSSREELIRILGIEIEKEEE